MLIRIDDHRFLVEPAAGAALAFVYSAIINRMDKEGKIPGNPDAPVVIIVCGGNAVTLDLINEWREHFLKKG
jgi:L-serine/L-threonine ammonia-lyase